MLEALKVLILLSREHPGFFPIALRSRNLEDEWFIKIDIFVFAKAL